MSQQPRHLRREVVVEHPSDRMDAELRRAALQSIGITARITTDDAGGMHPHLGPAAGGLRLLVPADRARDLLGELDAGTWSLHDHDLD